MNKQLMMILTSLALSFAAASTSYYPYDGIYHCASNIYGAGGNSVTQEEKARYLLPEEVDTFDTVDIIIKDHVMTFGGFKDHFTGGTAVPRVRASQRVFRSKGGAITSNLQKGDLLYASDEMVQIFFPRTYKFEITFLLETYRITYLFDNCEKKGGNELYIDPEEPTQIIERTDSRNIGGKVEYELALEAEGKRDNRKYIDLLLKSADLGYTDAMVALGFAHEMNRNYGKAYSWYRKAIQKGSKKAAYHLAEAYRYGVGVEENWEIAERLYHQAGPYGKSALGDHYKRNRDLYTAYELYKQGCNLKDIISCGKLEEMDESGFKELSAQYPRG